MLSTGGMLDFAAKAEPGSTVIMATEVGMLHPLRMAAPDVDFIAAVIDHFSDAVVKNAVAGQDSDNPALHAWHTEQLGRLPGLKFMRTLWVCNVSGGPFEYAGTKPGSTTLGLEEAHREFRISSAEFDEVAAELARTLDAFEIPIQEKDEVLAAFAAHKAEVTEGAKAAEEADFPDVATARQNVFADTEVE